MLTTIAKRVQTRLSKQGVKVALSDIRPVVEQSIKNIENPTEQEVLSVVEYFMTTATSLTVIPDDIDSINTLSIQEDVGEAIAPPQKESDLAPLAVSPKNELVANAAGELGIVLNTQEMELIAQNVNYSSDDLQESLEEIKSAIIAFVRHRIATNSQLIDSTLQEITKVATDGFNQNSQQLTDGLRSINNDIQEANKQFKSNVRTALSAFDIPALKAS